MSVMLNLFQRKIFSVVKYFQENYFQENILCIKHFSAFGAYRKSHIIIIIIFLFYFLFSFNDIN